MRLTWGALLAVFALTFAITGCQTTYLLKSAVSQADLLMSRVPVEDALKDPKLTTDQKRKLEIAQDARAFAERDLGLKKTKNYTSFVQLDRPYVTYVVSDEERNELIDYSWR